MGGPNIWAGVVGWTIEKGPFSRLDLQYCTPNTHTRKLSRHFSFAIYTFYFIHLSYYNIYKCYFHSSSLCLLVVTDWLGGGGGGGGFYTLKKKERGGGGGGERSP